MKVAVPCQVQAWSPIYVPLENAPDNTGATREIHLTESEIRFCVKAIEDFMRAQEILEVAFNERPGPA